jgi:hypothetical protein
LERAYPRLKRFIPWHYQSARRALRSTAVVIARSRFGKGRPNLWAPNSNIGRSVSVEAGLMDMLQRMESGRFKVFKHLNDWWEEFRLYHRKDGKVVKEGDDLMAATRYAIMMLRHASTVRAYRRGPLVYPKRGWL